MPISFSCSGCTKEYSVPEKFAGQRVKCKGCGAVLLVPAEEEPLLLPMEDEPVLRPLDDEPEEEPAARPSANKHALTPLDDDDFPAAASGARGARPRPIASSCPECGAGMSAEAILCIECGYHIERGRSIKPRDKAAEVHGGPPPKKKKKKRSGSGGPFWQDRDGSMAPWVRYAGGGMAGFALLSFVYNPIMPGVLILLLGALMMLIGLCWMWQQIFVVNPTAALLMLIALPFGLMFIPGFDEDDRARLAAPFKLFLLGMACIGVGFFLALGIGVLTAAMFQQGRVR